MTKEKELQRVYTIDLKAAAKEASRHDEEYQAMKKSTPPELCPALEAGYFQGFASGVQAGVLYSPKEEGEEGKEKSK